MELGVCIEMVFAKLPLEQRLARAAELGVRNAEVFFVDRLGVMPQKLAKLMEASGVTIRNTVIGSPNGKVGGGLTNPANRQQWLDRAKRTLDFNRAAGIGATIVCTGNDVPGLTDEQMHRSVVDGLKATAELAEVAGVSLLLEPLNTIHDHAGYWLASSNRGAEICREVGSGRLKLLFDCYHMQIMEGDLVNHIERNIDVIGHFHAAGVPGRHEVYNGEVNYRFVLERIENLGCQGVFGLEYTPSLDDAESVRKTLEYLGSR